MFEFIGIYVFSVLVSMVIMILATASDKSLKDILEMDDVTLAYRFWAMFVPGFNFVLALSTFFVNLPDIVRNGLNIVDGANAFRNLMQVVHKYWDFDYELDALEAIDIARKSKKTIKKETE